MNESERLLHVQRATEDMYRAGLGWNYNAIERLTRPPLRVFFAGRLWLPRHRPIFPHRRYGIKGRLRHDNA